MVIASGAIDGRAFGPLSESSSSFFSEDLIPNQRQVGFWKSESMVDQKGNKKVFSTPLEKVHLMGVNPACGFEHPGAQDFKGKLDVPNISDLMKQEENVSSLPSIPWGDVLGSCRSRIDLSTRETAFAEPSGADQYMQGYGSTPSSSSFSKSRLMSSSVLYANDSSYNEDEPLGSMKEIEAQTIGDLLPDDDDLLSGLTNDFEYTGLCNQDDTEEDIFYTGGGMELDDDDSSKGDKHEGSFKNNLSWKQYSINKHSSRTLTIKNIDNTIEDSEFCVLFQQYGDIRTLNTSPKNHGFVRVSYYDIRSAENAMRALHNKPLGLMNLDVQFSIAKDNVPNKYLDNGILAVSIVDSSISNNDLLRMLSVYGDIKEISKAPTSCNKKFVEFYDLRAAEAALSALAKGDMPFPKIKVELGHSEGVKSSFTEQCSGKLEDNVLHQLKNSPPGTIGNLRPKSWECDSLDKLKAPAPARVLFNQSPNGFPVKDPQKLSSPIRIETRCQHNNQATIDEPSRSGQGNFGCGLRAFHPHSLPECHSGVCNSSKLMLSARNPSFRLTEVVDYNNCKVSSIDIHSNSSDQDEALGNTGIRSCPLHGHHYTRSNSNTCPQGLSGPMLWSNFQQPMHMHGYHLMPPHMLNAGAHAMGQHLLGSAPNNLGGFASVHSFHPGPLESTGFPASPQLYPSDLSMFTPVRGNYRDTLLSPISAGFPSLQQMFHATSRRNPIACVSTSYDATNDRFRNRRHDGNSVQTENKKQFELDIDRIAKGDDLRTTLMIKNIPNKYNCKLLLAVIDENHRGTYDFIYLPIDFKNKCNVGYAFINMTDPQHIIPFYKTFNGKKWEKFNSEKVASLAYARIQGRNALIAHFQNSSLMNEEKWCRPILFHKDGPNAGDQEAFPVGNSVRSRSGRNRPLTGYDAKDATPSTSPN